MFLKNWDMLKLYRIQYTSTNRDILEDKEIRVINNIGNQDTISDSSASRLDEFNNSAYYTDGDSSVGGFFIWPGGDINSLPANPQPVIEREKIRYEDFNLYSPFQGGITPSSGMIYGQSHILSPAIYNIEKDQWERTVTREFKNESGSTITIRELGFYHRYDNSSFSYYAKLLAREILDTPIEVANDSYFKISFTYKVENPHENRELKRIRQYSLPFYYRFDGQASGTPFICSPVLNEQKKRLLLVRNYDIYDTNIITDELLEQYYEKIPLTLEGWSLEKHIGHYSLYNKKVNRNHEQTIITLDILTPDNTENNNISSPGYNTIYNSGYYVTYNIIFLEDDIETLSLNKENGLFQFDTNDNIEVSKLSNEQIMWICSNCPYLQLNSFVHQLDYVYPCDNLSYYGNYGCNFVIDNTEAISHNFKLPYNSDYEGGVIAKLTIKMKDNTPLYEDIPVQR